MKRTAASAYREPSIQIKIFMSRLLYSIPAPLEGPMHPATQEARRNTPERLPHRVKDKSQPHSSTVDTVGHPGYSQYVHRASARLPAASGFG